MYSMNLTCYSSVCGSLKNNTNNQNEVTKINLRKTNRAWKLIFCRDIFLPHTSLAVLGTPAGAGISGFIFGLVVNISSHVTGVE